MSLVLWPWAGSLCNVQRLEGVPLFWLSLQQALCVEELFFGAWPDSTRRQQSKTAQVG